MSEIKSVAVIGAGTMGNGIAQSCAMAGLSVALVDTQEQFLQQGMDNVKSSLARFVRSQKMTQDVSDGVLGRITPTTALKDAVAERRHRDRSRARNIGAQTKDISTDRRSEQARHRARDQHLAIEHYRDRLSNQAARRRYRHPFLQSRRFDATGGDHLRPEDLGAHPTNRPRPYPAVGKGGGGLQTRYRRLHHHPRCDGAAAGMHQNLRGRRGVDRGHRPRGCAWASITRWARSSSTISTGST